jgi:hypothetical protein
MSSTNAGLNVIRFQLGESGGSHRPRARRLLARAVAAKASFLDSSGHAGRDFVFTVGCNKDSNETAAIEEFTK